MKLVELRSDDMEFRAQTGPIGVLPLGAVEQHSRHLPLGTDAIIAETVAAAVEARLPESVVLLPTIAVGASDHHLTMPGTVSVGSSTIADAAARQCLSLAASSGIRSFLLLNGHGGNQPAVRLALETIHASDATLHAFGVDYWALMFARLPDSMGARTMGHADDIETSILLAVRPDLVHMGRAVSDEYRDQLPDGVFTTAGIPDRTSHGGVGDPTRATAEAGEIYLEAAVDGTVALVERLQDGMDAADSRR